MTPTNTPPPSTAPPNTCRTLGKTLAAVVTLGTGNSLGPEGPAVELGVASSRYVCSRSNLSVERQRMLLGAGAAAGVAAGFNAPIAGIFFALEIVKASKKLFFVFLLLLERVAVWWGRVECGRLGLIVGVY